MGDVRRIERIEQARELAAELTGAARVRPTVVITAGTRSEGLIDPAAVADGVGDLADVCWMRTGEVTWAFSERMPPLAQVYGDAARVYDLEGGWRTNPRLSRLHMCGTRTKGKQLEELLVSEAMQAAAAAGLLVQRTRGTKEVEAQVRGFPSSGRAIVRGDFGMGFAYVREELVVPGVPIEHVLTVGMVVRGRFDPDSGQLDLSGSVRSEDEAMAEVAVGDVLPARVSSVSRSVVTVELLPGRRVDIGAAQVAGDRADDLRGLVSVGEPVLVRVVRRSQWSLSMLDIEDVEPREAPPLLEGGPPWLDPPAPEQVEATGSASAPPQDVPEVEPVEAAAVGAQTPLPSTSPAPEAKLFDALSQEISQLRRSLDAATAEVARRGREVEHLRTERRRLLDKARRVKSGVKPRQADAFMDSDEQLRHDVYLAWVERVPAGEKPQRPLPSTWTIGPEFHDSTASMPPEVRGKLPDVVMEVLTGLADEMEGRDVHLLRSGAGGNDRPMEREPGEKCWRAAVQRNTPSAARLHYWRKGERIELSRVVRHDDMRP